MLAARAQRDHQRKVRAEGTAAQQHLDLAAGQLLHRGWIAGDQVGRCAERRGGVGPSAGLAQAPPGRVGPPVEAGELLGDRRTGRD